jgi:hypothetical protein
VAVGKVVQTQKLLKKEILMVRLEGHVTSKKGNFDAKNIQKFLKIFPHPPTTPHNPNKFQKIRINPNKFS